MSDGKKGYEWYRHHAWAGLAILSILVVLRSVFTIPNQVFIPIILVLIIYIGVALVGAYKYSRELVRKAGGGREGTKEEETELDKTRLKLEKKRAKADYKRLKKINKADYKKLKKINKGKI